MNVESRRGSFPAATVSLSQAFLFFSEDGLDVDEELSHGYDDGHFVGFSALQQSGHVLLDDVIVLCCGLGGM